MQKSHARNFLYLVVNYMHVDGVYELTGNAVQIASDVTIGMLRLSGMLIMNIVRPVGVASAYDEFYTRVTQYQDTDCMLAPPIDVMSRRSKELHVCEV